MRRSLVMGNWKMNGNGRTNEALLRGLLNRLSDVDQVDLAVCPPFPYLQSAGSILAASSIALGAQNVSAEECGAFTGEVSAAMLADVLCQYVLVGHSERRLLYGESSAIVAQKFAQVAANGLRPVLCVGETLAQREAGETLSTVSGQLDAVIHGLGVLSLVPACVAYEPVWAIGTGATATPEQAQEVHAFLRNRVAALDAGVAEGLRILYGGSVKASNAAALFAKADIDGALCGGSSLDADEFTVIAKAAGANYAA